VERGPAVGRRGGAGAPRGGGDMAVVGGGGGHPDGDDVGEPVRGRAGRCRRRVVIDSDDERQGSAFASVVGPGRP
jgi:hypothetical protein